MHGTNGHGSNVVKSVLRRFGRHIKSGAATASSSTVVVLRICIILYICQRPDHSSVSISGPPASAAAETAAHQRQRAPRCRIKNETRRRPSPHPPTPIPAPRRSSSSAQSATATSLRPPLVGDVHDPAVRKTPVTPSAICHLRRMMHRFDERSTSSDSAEDSRRLTMTGSQFTRIIIRSVSTDLLDSPTAKPVSRMSQTKEGQTKSVTLSW